MFRYEKSSLHKCQQKKEIAKSIKFSKNEKMDDKNKMAEYQIIITIPFLHNLMQ